MIRSVPDETAPFSVLLRSLRGVLAEVAEPTQVLRAILDQAVRETGAERGVFVEVGEAGDMDFRVLHRFERAEFDGAAGQFSRSLFARVLASGEGLVLGDALRTPGVMEAQSVQALRLVSVLCMPIRAGGRVAALVHLEHGRPRAFSDLHRALVQSLVDLAGPVLETLRAGRRVLHERDELLRALADEWSFGRFVGRTPAVRELERAVTRAAATDFPVLLTGETGTGKGILARVLHHGGGRRGRPFVTVFGPSLEKGLVESELFGYRRGAFTGAAADAGGKVQAAEGGTLFLDEIGELPLEIQPKILRLLQEKTYERVGDAAERRADVRIVAATHRDLEADVRAGRFRRDLFERLNYVPIAVPPLRERRADVPLLLRHALDHTPEGRWIEVTPEGERFLGELDFVWPGNVRHLEQLAARLIVAGPERPVGPAELARLLGAAPGFEDAPARRPDLELGLPALLEQAEREWLEQALRAFPGLTRRELAARLKIGEATLYKKLRAYDLGS